MVQYFILLFAPAFSNMNSKHKVNLNTSFRFSCYGAPVKMNCVAAMAL
jgi:hypothetical protein